MNKYRPTEEKPIDVLKVDNSAVRKLQLEKLARLKAERDPKAVEEALAALTRAADRGNGNLLALAVDAARAKATVGEISMALEKVFGRHRAEIKTLSGVYKREVGMTDAVARVLKLVAAFETDEGRRPRILVAKIGQDGHDRGQKVIASAFADLGFDVDVGPLFATPGEAARQAVENDVHVIGVSSLAAGHLTLVPEVKAELEKQGRGDIMIVVGGVVPPQDYDALKTSRRRGDLPARHRDRGSRRRAGEVAQPAARARARGGGVAPRLAHLESCHDRPLASDRGMPCGQGSLVHATSGYRSRAGDRHASVRLLRLRQADVRARRPPCGRSSPAATDCSSNTATRPSRPSTWRSGCAAPSTTSSTRRARSIR